MARTRRNLINVWAESCPRCEARVGEGCKDLRSSTGLLFGRRTHRERAAKVKEVKTPRITVQYNPVNWGTLTASISNFTVNMTALTNATTTTGGVMTRWYDAQQAQTWYRWAGTNGTTTRYTITDEARVIWEGWNDQYRPTEIQMVRQEVQADVEQRAREMESRRRLLEAQRLKRQEDRIVAEARAIELLRMILDPAQVLEMEQDQQVTVHAPSGRRYRVSMAGGVHGNIVELDEHGCPIQRGCVAPAMYDGNEALPTADGWVGQILALRHNEEELRAKTNWSERRRCQQPDVPILGRAA